MAIGNPFSTFADQDSFLGQPFLPRVGRFFSNMFSSMGNTMGQTPPTPAGVSVIPPNAKLPNLNPVPFLQGLNPFAETPLISGTALGRPPQQAPITPPTPTMPVLPSGTPMVGFDAYPTAKQSIVPPIDTQSQFATSGPRPATQDDIDYFYGRGKYAPAKEAEQVAQEAVRPASPYSNKVPIQTPYGTIYATPQQASSQRVSDIGTRPAQAARLEKIGEEARRSARIEGMRRRGARTAKQQRLETEEFFNVAQNKRAEERERKIQEAQNMASTASPRGQTRQRSWRDYVGENPISGFEYEDEETMEKASRRRRRA